MKVFFHLLIISFAFIVGGCGESHKDKSIFDLENVNKNSSGYIVSVGETINGKKEGKWIYCPGNSRKKIDTVKIVNYLNDREHGLMIHVQNSQDGWSDYSNWKNGKKDGEEYSKNKTGGYLLLGLWKDGRGIGEHTTYYDEESIFYQFREDDPTILFDGREHKTFPKRIKQRTNFDEEGSLLSKVSFNNVGALRLYQRYKNNIESGLYYFAGNIGDSVTMGSYKNGEKHGVWTVYEQRFKYQINEYEENEDFFKSILKKVDKKDLNTQVTYYNGKVTKERYYFKGKVFTDSDSRYRAVMKSRGFDLVDPNKSVKEEVKKKSAYSY